ncbi:MAG: zf-HC2 domain-containing protein, partial [Dehalococcoidia bacterium]
MTNEQLHDLAPGYALDALDDEDRRAFETHLGECERCREELASL